MRSSPRGVGVVRGISAGLFVIALLTAGLQAQKNAPKPDPKIDAAAQAQAMAQQQEIQTLVRLADSAMSGQTAPADFPIQFQNDFLKAQGSRVWVPIILTLDPAKVSSPALTLYLRVVPRGMTAPTAAPAPAAAPTDKNGKDSKDSKDKKKDQKAPATAAPAPAAR